MLAVLAIKLSFLQLTLIMHISVKESGEKEITNSIYHIFTTHQVLFNLPNNPIRLFPLYLYFMDQETRCSIYTMLHLEWRPTTPSKDKRQHTGNK